MNKSRLAKRLERQIIRNLFLSLLGIIVIVMVLVKFGIPILVNFSLFLSGNRTDQESQVDNKTSFVPVPILNSQEIATNSARSQINGSALPKQTIMLYVNGNLADKVSTDDTGDFSSIIALTPDKNTIKAKAIASDGKESDFSEGILIIFKTTPPTLEISFPSDNQSFSKEQNTVEVKGKTDSQVRVTINGFWAIIDDGNNFFYNLLLKEGINEIKLVATDQAGNKTEKELRVTYSP